MRLPPALPAALALASLATAAHADPLDHFSVTGNGQDYEFSLPASTTGPDYLFSQQYNTGLVTGTLNGAPATIGVHLIFPGLGAATDTFTVSSGSTYAELALPALYTLTFDPFTQTGTLGFLPGTYPSFVVAPTPMPNIPYTITITQQGTAVTPEPPGVILLGTACALLLCVSQGKRSRLSPAPPR